MSAKVAEHLHLSTYEKLEKDRLRLRSVAVQPSPASVSVYQVHSVV
jgi:hypothetical protein